MWNSYVCMHNSYYHNSGKFSQDKIFADADLPCRMRTQLCLYNSQILFLQMLGQPRNMWKFCPTKLSRYMVYALKYIRHTGLYEIIDV